MKVSRRSMLAGIGLSPAIAGRTARALSGAPQPVAVFAGSAALDEAIEQAIQQDQIPGAVLLIGHQGQVVHRKAYGCRSLVPEREPMTVDTIFDAASLTKVCATTPSLSKLFAQGKLRLNDPVTEYLPEFQGGRSDITIRHLMTHFSGMRPDLDLKPEWSGYDTGIQLALCDKPAGPPGARFLYSDINFILLGEVVRRLSGAMLSDYARDNFYRPLGMRNTMFQPPRSLRGRIAPTEQVEGRMLRGVVHDETARYMGGVAGHAGLFTTADDLARYAEALLGKRGPGLFEPLVAAKFTTPQSPADQPILRGLGWDIDSPFSGNRGELFPIGSYGHTGFTGTSIWIDPVTDTYVILLSNSVHPRRRPAITSLRCRVATVAAASLGVTAPGVSLTGYGETIVGAGLHRTVARNAEVLTGLDVLAAQQFAPLRGLRVGLITNHTGLDRDGKRNVDVMRAGGVHVAALFSPEHGLAGTEDRPDIANSTDPATGIPVWSLYAGKDRRPSPQRLREIDALIFDIQDVGARFYTYMTTMAYGMEAAAERKIPYFVLDRPNPITGTHVEGPVLEPDLRSFIGYYPIPLRHGMTAGELARLFNTGNRLGADLRVIAIENWRRGDWFDSTGLVWTDPSPNMRSLNAALLYPGVAMLEASRNYSVGRGTDAPFEQIGADWIDGRQLAAALDQRFIPGLRVYPTRFRPVASNFAGQLVQGVRFVITNRDAFDSSRLGLEIAAALINLFPGKIVLETNRGLIGHRPTIEMLARGEDPRAIQQSLEDSVRAFVSERQSSLLYR